MTLNFLLLGTGLHVCRELADIVVLRSVVLVQHLDPEFGVTRHILDLPEFVPYGLQCVCLDGRTAARVEKLVTQGQPHRWTERSDVKQGS